MHKIVELLLRFIEHKREAKVLIFPYCFCVLFGIVGIVFYGLLLQDSDYLKA